MRRRRDLLCDADWTVIGKNMRDYREDADKNQTEIGKLIGVSPQMISKIELGQMKESPIKYGKRLEKIADALGCDLEDLAEPRRNVRK